MFKHQFHHQYDLPFTSILHHNLSPYWHGQIYFILFSLTQRQLEWLNLRSTHVNFYLSKVLLKSVSKEILGCNSVLVEPSEPLVRLKEASSRLYYLPIRFQVILLGWYSRILKCLEFIYLKKLGGLEVWHGQVMELCPVVHSGREICNTLFWEGHCGFSPDLGKKMAYFTLIWKILMEMGYFSDGKIEAVDEGCERFQYWSGVEKVLSIVRCGLKLPIS